MFIFVRMSYLIGIIAMVCFLAFCWLIVYLFIRILNKVAVRIETSFKKGELKKQAQIESLLFELQNKLKKKKEIVQSTKTDGNPYLKGHERFKEDRVKTANLRDSFKKGYAQLEQQYIEYINWCKETGETPNQKPPIDRLKVYHLD